MTREGQRVLRTLVLRPTPPPIAIGIVFAIVAIALETLVVRLLELKAPGEAFEPVYLFGVVVVSAVWALGLAVATSLASALVLAYLRATTAGYFSPFDVENGVIVVIFLLVALFISLIAGLARGYAAQADQRRRDAEEAAAMLQESRDRTTVLAKQQEALRRVATLVARGVSPSQVFAAVAEEMARCLDVQMAHGLRYEPDSAAIVVASYSQAGAQAMPVGERLTLEGDNIAATVLTTGGTARMDTFEGAAGSLAARVRELGMRSGVGAPIIVDEHVWGLLSWARRNRSRCHATPRNASATALSWSPPRWPTPPPVRS